MNTHTSFLPFVILLASVAAAKPGSPMATAPGRLPTLSDGHPSAVLTGGSPGGASAKADTIYLLGGPDRDDGDFEEGGLPSWDGWTSEDLTAAEPRWNVSDFNCANLDPGITPNHAWWCGETFTPCSLLDDARGYGHYYTELLDWFGEVVDPGSAVTVTVNAIVNYDTEAGYDYLYLECSVAGVMQVLGAWDGTATGVSVSRTVQLAGDDLVPDPDSGLPAVHLRWRFSSDNAWDQEDCIVPNEGAAQIDGIEVIFDQGTPIQVSFEDNEDPDPADNEWRPIPVQGVGDFAKVWPALADLDLCGSNATPVVAFIDDGLVVPGTGGYTCTTWCYGPDGQYIVNPEGGLAGPESHINNVVVSPLLTWPGPGYSGAMLAFDVYRHAEFETGMFYIWEIQSTDSPDPAALANAPWVSDSMIYFGSPAWLRSLVDVSHLITPDCTFARVRLGVRELGYVWGSDGTDGTPAPYFDNVSVCAVAKDGPAVSMIEAHLPQDNFPASGLIDPGSPGNNSVRFDMAGDISAEGSLSPHPGDSIVVSVAAVRWGTVLSGNPRLHYRVRPNPLFDPYRVPGYAAAGSVEGWPLYDSLGEPLDKFAFDLPDSGWFFPGDVLHWYIEARDTGPAPALTLLPADTTGFSLFPGNPGYVPLEYPASFVVRALPSLHDLATGDQPDILFWNDFGNRGGLSGWIDALTNLSLTEGVDFDLYHTQSPQTGEGNGLGGRAAAEQLAGYSTILYTCGNLSTYTLSDAGGRDPGNDVAVLDAWLGSGYEMPRGKNLFLTGDNLASDLSMQFNGGEQFLSSRIGVYAELEGLSYFVQGQLAPLVKAKTSNSVFTDLGEWVADGGCPLINTFDAARLASGTEMLAEFTDPSGNPIGSIAAATLHRDYSDYSRVVYLPYDLMYVKSPDNGKLTTRGLLLREVLDSFAHPTSVLPLAPVADLSVQPGNNRITLSWTNPGKGETALEVWRAARQRCVEGPDTVSTYPEYDDWPDESIPTVPSDRAAAVADPAWRRVGLVVPPDQSFTDEGLDRGAYRYAVFPVDEVGYWGIGADISSLSYLLGDMTGDGRVTTADISVLGAAYGSVDDGNAMVPYNNECDVGPTEGNSRSGVPLTDNAIEFEDLMIFALNWDAVLTKNRATGGTGIANLAWTRTSATTWTLALTAPCANLQGIRLRAEIPAGAVHSVAAGDLLTRQDCAYFLQNVPRGGLDLGVALLGRDAAIVGCGELLTVTLNEPHDLGNCGFEARTVGNDPLDVDVRIEGRPPALPTRYSLSSNYPNPFNPSTTFEFSLPQAQFVQLDVYGVDGRRVATLRSGPMPAGSHVVTWNGRSDSDQPVAAGTYFCRLTAGEYGATRKMVLLK